MLVARWDVTVSFYSDTGSPGANTLFIGVLGGPSTLRDSG